MKCSWQQLQGKPDTSKGSPCTRSSHGVSVVTVGDRKKLVVYGGEHVARTPLDADQACWMLPLDSDPTWEWMDITSSSPPDRLAHAQATDGRLVYVFGGRAGITMEEKAMNDLWVLDPATKTWTEIEYASTEDLPEARSFHRMVCVGGSKLYVFGGCGQTSGRLNDLHCFDIPSRTWKKLEASKLRGRGGPNLVPLHSGKKLGVIAGFAGEETNDGQVYHLEEAKWDPVMEASNDANNLLKGLRPRSVCVAGSFPSLGATIIFGGEVDPSDLGHEGAGGFTNDVVILDEKTGAHRSTEPAPSSCSSTAWPGVRGWAAADGVEGADGKASLFLFGGLAGDDKAPTRLDDIWRLDISK